MSATGDILWIEHGGPGEYRPGKLLYSGSNSSKNVQIFEELMTREVFSAALTGELSTINPAFVEQLSKGLPIDLDDLVDTSRMACHYSMVHLHSEGAFYTKLRSSLLLSTRPSKLVSEHTYPDVDKNLIVRQVYQVAASQSQEADSEGSGGNRCQAFIFQGDIRSGSDSDLHATLFAFLAPKGAEQKMHERIKLGLDILDIFGTCSEPADNGDMTNAIAHRRMGVDIRLEVAAGTPCEVSKATLRTFMLDAARVSGSDQAEDFTFDVLYGVPGQMTGGNKEIRTHRYLIRGRDKDSALHPSGHLYSRLIALMEKIGLTKKIVENTKSLLRAILCMGNIEFHAVEEEEILPPSPPSPKDDDSNVEESQMDADTSVKTNDNEDEAVEETSVNSKAEAEEATVATPLPKQPPKMISVIRPMPWSVPQLREVSQSLAVPQDVLLKQLCADDVDSKGEDRAIQECNERRDHLANELYLRLVKTLEHDINLLIRDEKPAGASSISAMFAVKKTEEPVDTRVKLDVILLRLPAPSCVTPQHQQKQRDDENTIPFSGSAPAMGGHHRHHRNRERSLWDLTASWLDNKFACSLAKELVLDDMDMLEKQGFAHDKWITARQSLQCSLDLDMVLSDEKGLFQAFETDFEQLSEMDEGTGVLEADPCAILNQFQAKNELEPYMSVFKVKKSEASFTLLERDDEKMLYDASGFFNSNRRSLDTVEPLISELVQAQTNSVCDLLTTGHRDIEVDSNADTHIQEVLDCYEYLSNELKQFKQTFVYNVNIDPSSGADAELKMLALREEMCSRRVAAFQDFASVHLEHIIPAAEFLTRFACLVGLAGLHDSAHADQEKEISVKLGRCVTRLRSMSGLRHDCHLLVGTDKVGYGKFEAVVLDAFEKKQQMESIIIIQRNIRCLLGKRRFRLMREGRQMLQSTIDVVDEALHHADSGERELLSSEIKDALENADGFTNPPLNLGEFSECVHLHVLLEEVHKINEIEAQAKDFLAEVEERSLNADVVKLNATGQSVLAEMCEFPVISSGEIVTSVRAALADLSPEAEKVGKLKEATRVADYEDLEALLDATERSGADAPWARQVNRVIDASRRALDNLKRETELVTSLVLCFTEFTDAAQSFDSITPEFKALVQEFAGHCERLNNSLHKELRDRSDFTRGIQLRNLMTDLPKLREALLKQGARSEVAKIIPKNIFSARDELIKRTEQLEGEVQEAYANLFVLLELEHDWVAELMDSSVSLPTLNKSYIDLRRGIEARRENMNFSPIENSIQTISKIPKSQGMSSVLRMFREAIFCNKVILEKRYAVVILSTEHIAHMAAGKDSTSMEEMPTWMNKYNAWVDAAEDFIAAKTRNSVFGLGATVGSASQVPAIKPVPSFHQEEDLPPAVQKLAQNLESELLRLRAQAIHLITRDILLVSASKGALTVDASGVFKMTAPYSTLLQLGLSFLDELNAATVPSDTQGNGSEDMNALLQKALTDRCRVLCSIREYAAASKWHDINDLGAEDLFEVEVPAADRTRTRTESDADSATKSSANESDASSVGAELAALGPSAVVKNVAATYSAIVTEVVTALTEAKRTALTEEITSPILDHGLSEEPNSVSLPVASVDELEKAVTKAEKLRSEPWMSDYLLALIRHAQQLITVRKGLKRAALFNEGSQALSELEETFVQRAELGPEFMAELIFLRNVVEHKRLLRSLEAFVFKMPLEKVVVLGEDGVVTVDTTDLKLDEFQESLDDATVLFHSTPHGHTLFPLYFQRILHSAFVLHQMGRLIIKREWHEALDVLISVEMTGVCDVIPSLQPELQRYRVTLLDVLTVHHTRTVLYSPLECGPVGTLHEEGINPVVEKLSGFFSDYAEHKSALSVVLEHKKLAHFMVDLLNMAREEKWTELRAKCRQQLDENTSFCVGPLKCALIVIEQLEHEARNRLLLKQIIAPIVKERIIAVSGIIDPKKVNTSELQACISEVRNEVSAISRRRDGLLPAVMIKLAQNVLAVRKNMQSLNWFSCASNMNLLNKATLDVATVLANRKFDLNNRGSVLSPSGRRGSIVGGDVHGMRASILGGGSSGSVQSTGGGRHLGSILVTTGLDDDKSSVAADEEDYETDDQSPAVPQEYMDLMAMLSDEFITVRNAYDLTKCNADIIKILGRNGVAAETVGQPNLINTRVDDLKKVLETYDRLVSEGMIISAELKHNAEMARVTYKIRDTFLQKKSLIENNIQHILEQLTFEKSDETTKMPAAWKDELRVVRLELENERLVNRLRRALDTGALRLNEDGEAIFEAVSTESLESNARAKLEVNPRSDESFKLLATLDAMVELRNLLLEQITDFNACQVLALDLKSQVGTKLHAACLPELETFIAVCADRLVRQELFDALSSGQVSGQPGQIDGGSISAVTLSKASRKAQSKGMITSQTTNDIIFVVEQFKLMRNEFIEAHKKPGGINENANWPEIASMAQKVRDLYERTTHEQLWRYCLFEMEFIISESHVFKIRDLMAESISRVEKVYSLKNELDMGESTVYRKRSKLFTSSKCPLSCMDLEKIIEAAGDQTQSNLSLYDLLLTCRAMIQIRTFVMTQQFDEVRRVAKDEIFMADLSKFPPAIRELELALAETHNSSVANKLEACLRVKASPDLKPFKASELERLEREVAAGTAHPITDVYIQRLHKVAEHVLLMRKARMSKATDVVDLHLKWLNENMSICPASVHDEIHMMVRFNQNEIAAEAINKALEEGGASGSLADLRVDTIDTAKLEAAIALAEAVENRDKRVNRLISVASDMLVLRKAQREGDQKTVNECLMNMKNKGSIEPVVMEEVAMAHSEADNKEALQHLHHGLSTFKLNASQMIEIAINGTPQILDEEVLPASNQAPVSKPEAEQEAGPDAPESPETDDKSEAEKTAASAPVITTRVLENVNNYLNTKSLYECLDSAKALGIFTRTARMVYATVLCVKLLREAAKLNDWERVQTIISQADESAILGEYKFDPAGEAEISAMTTMSELNTSVTKLLTAMSERRGMALCSNGIVNTNTVMLSEIVNATEAVERSVVNLVETFGRKSHHDLNVSKSTRRQDKTENSQRVEDFFDSCGVPKTHGPCVAGSAASTPRRDIAGSAWRRRNHRQKGAPSELIMELALLMRSAKLVVRVRHDIQKGKLKEAGILAEEAMDHTVHRVAQEELTIYATEINRAMNRISLLADLRKYMNSGNLTKLLECIDAAKSEFYMLTDLGFVIMVHRATTVAKKLAGMEENLANKISGFDTAALDEAMKQCHSVEISEELKSVAQRRLKALQTYDETYKKLVQMDGGIITSNKSKNFLLRESQRFFLSDHPLTLAVLARSRLDRFAILPAVVVHAIDRGEADIAMMKTIVFRHALFHTPRLTQIFAVENFKGFRSADEFEDTRMIVQSAHAKQRIMAHTSTTINVSLTRLHHGYAALAVWIFNHTVRDLEYRVYSEYKLRQRRVHELCRLCPPMRDEVLAQHVKMINGNFSAEKQKHFWRSLKDCLGLFPCSEAFEPYLECFLFKCSTQNADGSEELAVRCIQNLHRSVFTYGYGTPIRKALPDEEKSCEAFHMKVVQLVSLDEERDHPGLGDTSDAVTNTNSLLFRRNQPFFMEEEIRGTQANWIRRFHLASVNRDGMKKADLLAALMGDQMDEKDKEVFLMLVTGSWPTFRRAIVYNFISHEKLFKEVDSTVVVSAEKAEVKKSQRRLQLLNAVAGPPTSSDPSITTAIDKFWNNVVKRAERCADGLSDDIQVYTKVDDTVVEKQPDVVMDWRCYRDVLLGGMQWLMKRSGGVIDRRAAQKQQEKVRALREKMESKR